MQLFVYIPISYLTNELINVVSNNFVRSKEVFYKSNKNNGIFIYFKQYNYFIKIYLLIIINYLKSISIPIPFIILNIVL